jgi:ribonuclease J
MLVPPEVISRGFVYVRENDGIMEDVRKLIINKIEQAHSEKSPDWAAVKAELRNELRKFLYEKTKRNPMIIPIVVEI